MPLRLGTAVISVTALSYETKDAFVVFCHHRSMHRSMLYFLCSVTAAFCLLAVTWHLYAAEPAQSPRRHSLIHRQAPEGKSADAVVSTEVPRSGATPPPRSLHRKLTKRPAQLPTTGPSTDINTSQSTAPSSQATSAIQPSKTVTDSRVTTTTGSTGIGASTVPTAPITSMATGGSTSSLASTSSARVPTAGVVAGASVGASTSRSSTSVGRGLQRLTAEMPSLTQLVAPTVSLSSTSTSPTPSPGTTQAPSSSTPTSTEPATSSGTRGATLSWTLNSETDLAGYKVYLGTAPGIYSFPGSPIVIGRTDNYAITGLPVGQTYYFAISAFDSSGNESALSSEVSKSIY